MTGERAAYEILLKVTREDAYLNLALKDALNSVASEDRAYVTALVYTASEHLAYCDHLIESYAKGRIQSSVRCVLRLALTELFFMDKPDYAVCSRALKLTEEIGKGKLKGFVNGVLRTISRDRAAGSLPELPLDFTERMRVMSGYPEFLIREYVRKYGEEKTEKLLNPQNSGIAVRPVFPADKDEIREHFLSKNSCVSDGRISRGALAVDRLNGPVTEDELFKKGRMTVQSEGAMLSCEVLEPGEGMRVLDACAAPGGKSAYICDLMKRSGYVAAWDIHPHRVKLIESTLSRLGIEMVDSSVRDASVYAPALESSFDRILLDVPCSGLGGGSKPDARLRRTEESIREISLLQSRILETCSAYLKPDGLLVYSTCTVSESENENVVQGFLGGHPDFELKPFHELVPEPLKERASQGMLQLLPCDDGTEGFFLARLGRRTV